MTSGLMAGPDRGVGLRYPSRRDEAWRHAPHARLGALRFGSVTDRIDPVAPMLDGLLADAPPITGPRIVIINGVFDADRSVLTGLPDGVTLSGLAAASSVRPDVVAAHFVAAIDAPADAFVALNATHGRDGACLEVADGVAAGLVQVIHVTVPGPGRKATAAGVAVRLGHRSMATIVEAHIGGGEPGRGGASSRTTIALGEEATLDHVTLQDVPVDQISLCRVDVTQDCGSVLRARCFELGASYGRLDYRVNLVGEAATADLAGLLFGSGHQILDQQVTVIHRAQRCVSRQAFRGVVGDAAVGVFNGGIDVRSGADGTDAEQSSDNLLLSTRAEINSQPRLDILADDVTCRHGATVGQLDEMALYYLRSRGIPGQDAKRLLVSSFADRIVDLVEIEAVRAWVTARLGHDHDQVETIDADGRGGAQRRA